MLVVRKHSNDNLLIYEIETEDGILSIYKNDQANICWTLSMKKGNYIYITKEDEYVYEVFTNIYNEYHDIFAFERENTLFLGKEDEDYKLVFNYGNKQLSLENSFEFSQDLKEYNPMYEAYDNLDGYNDMYHQISISEHEYVRKKYE